MNTTNMLEMCSCRVTAVGLAFGAISALWSGKAKFDILMADVNSPDLRAFELLYHAVNMDLPLIFMSAVDDTYLATRALENGAFMFIKKPATMEILRCLWQHVYREKRRNEERFQEIAANKRNKRSGMDDNNPGCQGQAKEKIKGQTGDEDQRYRKGTYNLVNVDDDSNKGVKRKVCTDWTEELHAKFVDAVAQLGEGRCFPKEILELMDVPGLTRMQVASHLQKCRNNNWQTPEERRSPHVLGDLNKSQHKPRKFGSMPQLGRTDTSPQSAQISGIQPENETQNNRENVGHFAPSTMTTHVQFEPGPSNIHSSDDFFRFQDPVRPIRNFVFRFQDPVRPIRNFSSTVPQGSRAPRQTFIPQNSAVASVDSSSKGQWSSETSNVESDDRSETKDKNIKSE
ncbi:two-component response regulator ORR26-like [Henckelia pumila]|uniref:two-component response regulator ORR26-like n=1 Tax=Henckelia pumila TaxID=405737 RepID=UPI003C6DBD8B